MSQLFFARFSISCLSLLAAVTGVFGAVDKESRAIQIALVGDSTVSDYPPQSPIQGWGEYVQGYLASTTSITNFAVGGASSRTFIDSPRWQRALALRPDYVLIQFGHNDSDAPDHPEATNAATEFPDFLRRFVREARSVGVKPIFVTPMERRSFDEAGHVRTSLAPYAAAMRKVAQEQKVPLVDLHTASCRLYAKLGEQGTAALGSGINDRTHFSEKGARAMAQLVATDLVLRVPALKKKRSR